MAGTDIRCDEFHFGITTLESKLSPLTLYFQNEMQQRLQKNKNKNQTIKRSPSTAIQEEKDCSDQVPLLELLWHYSAHSQLAAGTLQQHL